MQQVFGTKASGGIAMGRLHVIAHTLPQTGQRAGEPAQERANYFAAKKKAVWQLESLAQSCREQENDVAADVLEAQSMMLEGDDFDAAVTEKIDGGVSAVTALEQTGEEFYQIFAAMDEAYYRERAEDMHNISRYVIEALQGGGEEKFHLEEPSIIWAEDLAPSETVRLKREMVLGFITEKGSTNGHTAILARGMGIPMICCAHGEAGTPQEGILAILDGETGCAILDPDAPTRRIYREKLEAQKTHREELEQLIDAEDITLDGQKLKLYCNIGSEQDVPAVLANGGRGVGLMRTEFLYIGSDHFPTEEEQFGRYKAVAEAMGEKPVIIRTLDIGADKSADYFGLEKEENPALGLRAIRICLTRPELFRTQLRAIYRASAFGNLNIMFPMVTSRWEVEACLDMCRQVREELEAEHIPVAARVPLGIMVETPAAVLMAEELAGMVDFFSIGTNDLTQYMLACDRQSNALNRFNDPHNPAVLRAIEMTVRSAHNQGKWVGICGELGSDRELLEWFLKIGVDELSVSPDNVLPIRRQLRELNLQNQS